LAKFFQNNRFSFIKNDYQPLFTILQMVQYKESSNADNIANCSVQSTQEQLLTKKNYSLQKILIRKYLVLSTEEHLSITK